MQTILVLTDFSEAATYAAAYACVLARQLGIQRIVLYHSYQSVISPGEAVQYIGDEKSLHLVAEQSLNELIVSLKEQVPEGSVMLFRTDTRSLDDINDIALDVGAEMIVMGVTGKGKLEEIVAGSNAIRVCEKSDLPVLLVPAQIPMHPVGNLVFACDLQDEPAVIPQQKITNMLKQFHVPLSVVYVEKDEESDKELHGWMNDYNPRFYNLDGDDTATAILDFAKEISSPIILVVAKEHGFPTGLFHRSITKQLAFHSTVPLLVLRAITSQEATPIIPLLEI